MTVEKAKGVVIDEKLIRRASLRATGADIHGVNCEIGCYRNWGTLINRNPATAAACGWTDKFRECEAVLLRFVAYGRLDRSNRGPIN